MRWQLDEKRGDINYEVSGNDLILKIKPEVIASIHTSVSGGGSTGGDGIYHIKLADTIRPSDENAFTALRTLKEIGDAIRGSMVDMDSMFIRKDIDDVAHGNILFDKVIGSSIFIDDWQGKGWEIRDNGSATFNSAHVRSDIITGRQIGSPTFASGFTGFGWRIIRDDKGVCTGEMDNIFIRKEFTAYTITYSQIYGLGGSQIVSDLNKILRVEVLPDRYRCYMDSMDGLMLMNLREGDGVRIQTRVGTTSIKYLLGRCIGTTSDYFDIAIPLLEGSSQPEAGDFAMRWGNSMNTDRQGFIYMTSSDSGAPFIDVYDGVTGTSTEGCLKVRLGKLTGIRTQKGDQLNGYGAYLNGVYVENSNIVLNTGDTIEQTFIAMNGKFESLIEGIRNDMSSLDGNILKNSSFNQNLNYWDTNNTVHFVNVGGSYLWMNDAFYVEKESVTDIINDSGHNVLRVRVSELSQPNANMTIPVHKPSELKTYSFSIHVKCVRSGLLEVGFRGTDLFVSQQIEPSDSYQRITKVGKWDGKGDFIIKCTGEVYCYGAALMSDDLADSLIKLESGIIQLQDQIKLFVTKQVLDEATGAVKQELSSKIDIQAEQMSGISTRVDNINNTISTAGWITEAEGATLFASKKMEDGDNIISAINVSPGVIKIKAEKINLIGSVTFSMLDQSTQNSINGKADASSLGSLATKNDIGLNDLNTTIIQGGHIIADLIDVNTIMSDKGIIGGFKIEKDGISSTGNYSSNNKYRFYLYSKGPTSSLIFAGNEKLVQLGLDVSLDSLGHSSTMLQELRDHAIPEQGLMIWEKVGARISVKNGVRNYALHCNGGIRLNGPVFFARYTGRGGDSHDNSIINNLGYKDTFVFQPTSAMYVYLPNRKSIEDKVGTVQPDYNDPWSSVGDNSVIFIYIIVSAFSSAGIVVKPQDAQTPIINQDSVIINEFSMKKGDCATFAYHNGRWYTYHKNF